MHVPRTQISHRHNHQNHTYRSRATSNFLIKNRNPTQNYESGDTKFFGDQEVVQFKPNQTMESDDSGVCTPPLWKTTNPSPPRSPSQPLLSPQSLSPNSRAQAIARGQWELMEMVKNMPESSYELTLKDIVDHPKLESQVFQTKDQRSPNNMRRRGKYDKNVMRNESFENKGVFLKMVFPFSLESKKKKSFRSNKSGKVSPKPEGVKGGGEKDWWKKRFRGSTDSDSSRTSTNTGSTGSSSDRRKRNGFLTSCWPRLQSRSSKSV